jgi:phosphatidylinositol-3-phosphatase
MKRIACGLIALLLLATGAKAPKAIAQVQGQLCQGGPCPTRSPLVNRFVFVIAMENHDAEEIIGNATDAPYINNTLVPAYAQASNFNNQLALSVPSEPHYVWMEAGTNVLSDHTFWNDDDPGPSNSTVSTAHLVTQIKYSGGLTWRTYQEDLNPSTTGACPVTSSAYYAPKHNPFVFFQDVSGNPASKTNAYCATHTEPYSSFAADLAANNVASYTFITPNLCHDMHGAAGCPTNTIAAGDAWLSTELPPIIAFVNAHSGVIFIVWGEGGATLKMPFLAVGPNVKPGHVGAAFYNHGSMQSVEEILALPILPAVSANNDFTDLFQAGYFP